MIGSLDLIASKAESGGLTDPGELTLREAGLDEWLKLTAETGNTLDRGEPTIMARLTPAEAALLARLRVQQYMGRKADDAYRRRDWPAFHMAMPVYERFLAAVRRSAKALGLNIQPR
jgi:hypothetical protein